MTQLTLLLVLFVPLVIAGCSAENPVCSTNFCAVGEIFPRSDLDANTAFSEVDIDDSVIFATLVGTPVPVVPIGTNIDDLSIDVPQPVTLADIVSDVALGSRNYAGKPITITAVVDREASTFENRNALTLNTNNDNVVFFVTSDGNPNLLANYNTGESYTFDLFVLNIRPPSDGFPYHGIFTGFSTEKISETLDTIVSDVARGGTSYISKIISLTAVVNNSSEVFIDTSDTISLVTNRNNVIFFVSNWAAPPNIMSKYQRGESYEFDVFIRTIEKNGNDYIIQSYIVLE